MKFLLSLLLLILFQALLFIPCHLYSLSWRNRRSILRKMQHNPTEVYEKSGRGIFWDVDGTLCDSHELCFSSTNYVLQNHCKPSITEEEYHEGVKFTTPRRMAWHFSGNPDDPMAETLGKEFDDLYVQLVSAQSASLYPGINNVLQELGAWEDPKVHLAALSNACTDYVEAVMRVHNLAPLFSVQLGADKVPKAKPAAEGLLLCCERLNLRPSDCVYVGDSPTDGQAAKNAGMPSIGVTWGSHSNAKISPHFDVIVHNANELREQLRIFLSK